MQIEKRKDTQILLRIQDVAEKLGVGGSTVYQLINAGAIPVIRIGRGGLGTKAIQDAGPVFR